MTEEFRPDARVTDKRRVQPDDAPQAPQDDLVEEPQDGGDQLEAARAQAQQYLDDLRRVQAEFENYRKRMLKEQAAVVDRAAGAVVERLLPVLDDFELALLAADRTQDYEAMVRGVELVFAKLREVLEKEGLERIESHGKPFDPELHEAVLHADGDGDELVVVDEMRPGYKLAGRVLRPSMVKVARRTVG